MRGVQLSLSQCAGLVASLTVEAIAQVNASADLPDRRTWRPEDWAQRAVRLDRPTDGSIGKPTRRALRCRRRRQVYQRVRSSSRAGAAWQPSRSPGQPMTRPLQPSHRLLGHDLWHDGPVQPTREPPTAMRGPTTGCVAPAIGAGRPPTVHGRPSGSGRRTARAACEHPQADGRSADRLPWTGRSATSDRSRDSSNRLDHTPDVW